MRLRWWAGIAGVFVGGFINLPEMGTVAAIAVMGSFILDVLQKK